MRTHENGPRAGAGKTAEIVRRQIESSGERLWQLADFDGLPFTAVAQTLSRLARQGAIERLGKGLYYRPRQTAFGPSRPNMARIRSLALSRNAVFPAGIAAANLLGFTTQNAARIELATDSTSLPSLFFGKDALVHTRRPAAWRNLSETDAALLDFLRNRGESSELPPEETVERLLQYFREPGRFDRLLKAAPTEPPRVRAMLGAIGEQTGQPESHLTELRESLNSLSRFDFGILAALALRGNGRRRSAKPMRLFEHPDFEQAIIRAAEHFRSRGLREAIIEKDYYVTEALRIIEQAAGPQVIFKGGTSLSKGWGLIQRFSEDIDIFLDPTTFEPPLGKKGIDRGGKKRVGRKGDIPNSTAERIFRLDSRV